MDADAARQAWLVEAIGDDNRVWWTRDPALLATKYDVMVDDRYDYLRATAGVFLRDVSRAGTARAETTFLTDPGATEMLIVGDPHPENIGTFFPDPALLLEPNDFDGAGFGPYLFDLRRLILGLSATADASGCDCVPEMAQAAATAYLLELEEPTAPSSLVGPLDAITQRLVDDVVEEGMSQERLLEYTELTATGRRFRPMLTLDEGDGVLPLEGEEAAQLDRLLAGWTRAPAGLRVFDRARRFGGGVASLPAVRYVVVFDAGDDGPDDDRMISVREVVDPPNIPGIFVGAPARFDDAAHRVDAVAAQLWSHPEADPLHMGLTDGAMTFKVQSWTSWQSSYDHVKVVERVASRVHDADDLIGWAEACARVLAGVHRRSTTASGEPAGPAILRDVAGRGPAFVDERVRDATLDLEQLAIDHLLFVDAMERLGPLLGADRLEIR
jgi:uncharacterized protein (DUF2252 family)